MSPLTNALISYWKRLPAESPAVRRRCLESTCERVSHGMDPRSALLPYALGDADDDIVATATRAYVRPGAEFATRDAVAIEEAVDWVRRGLALNRGAAFGALLSLGEDAVFDRLLALRLGLSAPEVEAACRVLGSPSADTVAEFLGEWLELLSDGPLEREQQALATVLHAAQRAQAA